jgi:TolB-like protein/DNA-binding winged helix-turn-helix (wHTH) protein/Tfp pilus assembly protein PilF
MRPPFPPSTLIRFGVFEVDLRSGELRKQGLRVKLQEQPFRVLAILLEHPGEVVTREELHEKVWGSDTFVDIEHGLATAVKKIREALGDDADTPRYMETLPRRGYRFICPVAPVYDRRPENAARRAALQRRFALAAAGLIALVVVLLVFNVAGLRERVPFLVGARRAVPLPKIESIAVLPLENLSGDPEQEYFADGMTDELITNLGKISALRVISRTSAMHYKGTRKRLPEIARELNVDAIVEGTVMRSGGRVRITANLLHAPTDRHLWAETYERDLRNMLALQSDVAQAIAREVRIKLTPQEQARLARRTPVNPKAYEACVMGRYHWNRRTEEALRKGIECFHQAIDLEPRYAAAYAGLADCHNLLPLYAGVAPREAFPKGKSAAAKAVDLDELNVEAHAALAWAKLAYDFDWRGAEEEFRRALVLNPSYETAHLWYGLQLVWTGRFDQGLAELQRARELDPVSLAINRCLGMGLYAARRYDKAIAQLNKTSELDPTFSWTDDFIGLAYVQKGMYREAVTALERAPRVAKTRPLPLGRLGYGYAMAGKRTQALATLQHLTEWSKREYVPATDFAFVYVALGEKEKAFLWLEKAYEERWMEMLLLKTDARFDPLRSDPRFQDLLRRMDFPE